MVCSGSNSFICEVTWALCLVLDPALLGLSLVYVVSMNGMLQYAVRLGADVENLVRGYVYLYFD